MDVFVFMCMDEPVESDKHTDISTFTLDTDCVVFWGTVVCLSYAFGNPFRVGIVVTPFNSNSTGMIEHIEHILCSYTLFVTVFATRIDREHTGNRLCGCRTARVHLWKVDDRLFG